MAGIINDDLFGENVRVGTLTPGNPYDISVEKTVSGLIGESIQNISNNAAAGVNLQLIVEPATADAFTLYSVNGANTWSTGIDNSDSDAYKITTGATPSIGTTAINITTAGVVTLPAAALDVPSGGTGVTSNTAYAVLCGGTAATNPIQSIASVGNAGDVLTSNGAGALPTFQPSAAGDVTASANLTDNAVVRGDGGAKGVQTSTVLISDAGEMTNPSQPAFSVTANDQTNVTGAGTVYTVQWATEIFDQGGDFAANTFTAPITGKYRFELTVTTTDINSMESSSLYLVTTARTYQSGITNPTNVAGSGTNYTFHSSFLANMTAADTAIVQIALSGGAGDTADVQGAVSFFSGSLVC